MAFEATFRHGNPTTMDHTPAAGDIAAGQVVVVNNTVMVGIAHLPIANGELGALSVGGGVYDVKVAGNYAAGSKVYWDDTAAALTTTSTNNTPFGWTVETAAAANAVVEVLNWPFVP